MIFKKGDYIFAMVVVSVVLVLFLTQLNAKQGNQVRVTVGKQTETYSLTENRRISLRGKMDSQEQASSDGVTNVLVIEDGQVYMESASCPDQVCVKHKPIYQDGEMIICLPHQVYVEVDNDIENDIDN
ncbi:MAG: NusG domain II-containing protein [Lachnospiraceae bacterium]|nr:NusG domain II-containing protein [Lachnospiraceae bacterium]